MFDPRVRRGAAAGRPVPVVCYHPEITYIAMQMQKDRPTNRLCIHRIM
jgi:hypothetical protein